MYVRMWGKSCVFARACFDVQTSCRVGPCLLTTHAIKLNFSQSTTWSIEPAIRTLTMLQSAVCVGLSCGRKFTKSVWICRGTIASADCRNACLLLLDTKTYAKTHRHTHTYVCKVICTCICICICICLCIYIYVYMYMYITIPSNKMKIVWPRIVEDK